MNATDLITKIKDLLSQTNSINTYCQTKYGKLPSIFIGIDINNVPRIEKYPALILYDLKIERGLDKIVYVVSIGVGIENNEIQTTDNVYSYTGFIESKELKELIEIELCATLGKITFLAEYIPDALFPIIADSITFSVEYIVSRRGMRQPI